MFVSFRPSVDLPDRPSLGSCQQPVFREDIIISFNFLMIRRMARGHMSGNDPQLGLLKGGSTLELWQSEESWGGSGNSCRVKPSGPPTP